MRVHRIGLYSNDSEVAKFETAGPDRRNPFVLKSVAGLDAEQITPKFYGQGIETGTNFMELSLEPREVVIKLGYNPNWSVETPEQLRSNLLRSIASNRSGLVQLRFYDNEVVVGVLDGFITKFETPASTKESESTITVKCENPLFRSLNVTSQIVDDLSISEPLLIDPVSTAPHGFAFKMTFVDGGATLFSFQDSATPDWEFHIAYDFDVGDELYFSSMEGNKYLYRVRSAVALHLVDQLEIGSVWPLIFPGENQYYVDLTGFDGGASYVWNELYWYETHWGI